MQSAELQALRNTIDRIDEDIVALIAKRFVATQKVGIFKAKNGIDAVDPSREQSQMARYEALAQEYRLNADFVGQVFRCVIDEVVINHKALAAEIGNRY